VIEIFAIVGVLSASVVLLYASYLIYNACIAASRLKEIPRMEARMDEINKTLWDFRSRVAALEGGRQIAALKSSARKGADPVS